MFWNSKYSYSVIHGRGYVAYKSKSYRVWKYFLGVVMHKYISALVGLFSGLLHVQIEFKLRRNRDLMVTERERERE